MPLDPECLRRCKARKNDVAGQATEPVCGVQFGGFFMGPRVVPKHARTQDLISLVHEGCTMHLSRQPDPANGRKIKPRRKIGERDFAGLDPRVGVLFGPPRMRAGHSQRGGGTTDHLLRLIDQKRFQPGRSQIKSDVHTYPSRLVFAQTSVNFDVKSTAGSKVSDCRAGGTDGRHRCSFQSS